MKGEENLKGRGEVVSMEDCALGYTITWVDQVLGLESMTFLIAYVRASEGGRVVVEIESPLSMVLFPFPIPRWATNLNLTFLHAPLDC